jgi:hypothetical protein
VSVGGSQVHLQLEGIQDLPYGGQGRVALASLDPADVGLRYAGAFGELNLGKVQLSASCRQRLSKPERQVVGRLEVRLHGVSELAELGAAGLTKRGDHVLVRASRETSPF